LLGFPLNKAIQYSELRKPFLLNDLESQYLLQDRQRVYEKLQAIGVPVPRYAVLRRDEANSCDDPDFMESEDTIRVHGMVFHKPFVEKPLSAEDHNVYIYFPSQAGGGCQQLFRKIGSLSSRYCDQSQVRKSGSYIYENFMPTEGTDVKVYTVGPEYVHAEARKSPSLDGKVERDYQGKEIRYPVILSAIEKEIANKVCNAFKQTVCGFDLLRGNGMSYVCDVNGFSFVKTSKKYYEDCSQVLGHMILQNIAPQLSIPDLAIEDTPFVDTPEESMLELRCVMAVIRHGDRTPKQKMKMEVRNQMFFDLFHKYGGTVEGKLKLKKPKQLQEVLDIVRVLLDRAKELRDDAEKIFESHHKLEQLKSVLEMYGHFSGINRKIQFKYLESSRGKPEKSACEDRGRHGYASGAEQNDADKDDCNQVRQPSLLLIMKWGGELTPFGREQAVEMGKSCRCMYPGGRGEYASLPGCGLLRLHSTYRHDLKIYASDEGRVQMTAAAFAKGLLALEGELTPILVHLVRCDKHATKMLDAVGDPQNLTYKIKGRLHEFFNLDKDLCDEDYEKIIPTASVSQLQALKFIKNPFKMCRRLYSLVQSLTAQLREMMKDPNVDPQDKSLYHNECLDLMVHRWSKLEKDFRLRNGKFDISLIPDIYDCIKYDVFHNNKLNLRDGPELFKCAKALADVVIPQEYGITEEEKMKISKRTCQHLCRKLLGDLRHADQSETTHRLNPQYSRDIVTPHRHVRTRLYFTSESHIHTMINAIRYGNLCDDVSDEFWKRTIEYFSSVPELNYMTQIVLMLYEDPQADKDSDKRFHIELHFSPGVKCDLEEAAKDSKLNLLHKKPGFRSKEGETDGKQTKSYKGPEQSENNVIRKEHASDVPVDEETEKKAQSNQIEGHSHSRACRRRSEDLVVRTIFPAGEGADENTMPTRRKSTGRSRSECECPVKSTDALNSDAGNLSFGYKAKSLESIHGDKVMPVGPIDISLSDDTKVLSTRENAKALRSTISTPSLIKTQKCVTRAALGPVFSVPGVRKLALQSAVPMANVVTRPRASITEDNFLSEVAAIQGDSLHSVLSWIHPLKTLHGCIPLRQMETFLRKISDSYEPELTPDPQNRWMTNQTSHGDCSKSSCGSNNSPLMRDLADSIPKGQDGIDIAEFEACEVFDKGKSV
ncbi:inositol hexakisphosphate and diphosphoinositol-pentakisphosphate kinase 2-like, partial [Dendronephthya gigantea]|uniref:inositol hexakisphosphate and diphosphoinositol-pentakisphosphate kinase 2-like n=1 Tax=Dendronephthya gigantea TaxID=151771 RepID=UPI0010699646